MTRTWLPLAEQATRLLPAPALDDTAAAALWRAYPGVVTLEPPSFLTGGQWRIRAGNWVGFLPLSRGLGLAIQPKVPIAALLRMVELAHDLAGLRFPAGSVPVTTLPEMVASLARLLAAGILTRARRGLHAAYTPQEAELPVVRGRIRAAALARRAAPTAVPCAYHDRRADIADNRILAWTLHTILRQGLCQGETRALVTRAYRLLAAQVSLVPCRAEECRGRVYTRLNQDYAPLHALCAFFLEASGPSHLLGDQPMLPFLLDMPRLFERTVAAWLRRSLAPTHHVTAQAAAPVGHGVRFVMDVVIESRDPAPRRWVLDTKYKVPAAGPDATDVAQVLAYAQVQRGQTAVLVYPQPLLQPLDVQVEGIRLRTLSFDLAGDLDAAGQALRAALLDPTPTVL